MDRKSFSTPQLQARSEAYFEYQDELERIQRLYSTALQEIRSVVKPNEFIRSKSAETVRRVVLEEDKSKATIMEKLRQIDLEMTNLLSQRQSQGQRQVAGTSDTTSAASNTEINRSLVTLARTKFDSELKKARSCFDEMMAKAMENVPMDTEEEEPGSDPEAEIGDLRDSYEKTVEQAWRTFNGNIRQGYDVEIASFIFACEADHARKDFEVGVKIVRDNFSGGNEDSAVILEYEGAVNHAVEEFVWWVSSAVQYFCDKMDQMVEREKEKVRQGNSHRQQSQSIGGESVKEKREKEVQSPHLEKYEGKSDEVFEEPLNNQSTLQIIVQIMEKMVQRMDNLEDKLTHLSDRFASLVHKQQHQDKKQLLVEYLEMTTKAQAKEIEKLRKTTRRETIHHTGNCPQ